MSRLLPLLALLMLVTACASTAPEDPVTDQDAGSPDPTSDASDAPASADGVLVLAEGSTATGPGISIGEALGQAGGAEPLLVNGALFIHDDGTVLLCEAVAESFPPQCGGMRLLVEGLEPGDIPDLEEAEGVRWAEMIQLLGHVQSAP